MHHLIAMMTDAFVSHVAGHAGTAFAQAERATRVVLAGLGAYLPRAQRQLIEDELPASLASSLEAGHSVAVPIVERLIGPGVGVGRARELLASVCRVLAEELSNEALFALRAATPREISTLLARPSPELATPVAEPRRDATLASGHPGSLHPIADTPPAAGQTGSVTEKNPHGAAKLSSSPGLTQERRHETLAEIRPSEPTLAESHRR